MAQRTSNNRITSGKRGFAAMSREKQREIAAKGGRASHGSRSSSASKSR